MDEALALVLHAAGLCPATPDPLFAAYEGKPLVSVMKGELGLGDVAAGDVASKDETHGDADGEADHAPVLEKFREALGERVKEVRATRRLSTSPACLVGEEYEPSRHLERILDAAGQKIDAARPILEINPDHTPCRG